jgi:hypothetical protein
MTLLEAPTPYQKADQGQTGGPLIQSDASLASKLSLKQNVTLNVSICP